MIRPPKSEEVKGGKPLFAIIRALMARLRKRSRDFCFNFQEIISLGDFVKTVPQTDTGGLGEYPKVSERRIFKEFGKKSTRNLGRWVAPHLRGCN